MIDSKTPVGAQAPRSAPIRDSDADILERAVAILTEETSFLPAGPAKAAPPKRESVDYATLSRARGLDQLRARAVDAVTALLAGMNDSNGPAAGLVVPWRKAAAAARPGDDTGIPLTIDNGEDRPVALTFYSTDLMSDAGYQIPARLISFDPPSQTVAPRSRGTTRMTVAVPVQAMPGTYSALVQAVGLAASKAVVTLDIL